MQRGTAEIHPVRAKAMPTPAEKINPLATTPKAVGIAPSGCTGVAMQPEVTCPAGGQDEYYLQAAQMMVQQQLAHQAQQAAHAVAMQEWLVQQQVMLQSGGAVHPMFAQGVAQVMGQPTQQHQKGVAQQPQQVQPEPAQTTHYPDATQQVPQQKGFSSSAWGKGAPSASVSPGPCSPHEHQAWQQPASAASKMEEGGDSASDYGYGYGHATWTDWPNTKNSWDTDATWNQKKSWVADKTWKTNTAWQTNTWNTWKTWNTKEHSGQDEEAWDVEPEPEETEEIKKYSVVLDSDTNNFPCPFDRNYIWIRMKKPPPAAGAPCVIPAKRKTVPHPAHDPPPRQHWQYSPEETEEVKVEPGH